VKYFKHMLEGKQFTIYTDHKPITYALNKDVLQRSPRQARHLKYISQFSTDIRHINGKSNIVADALSRVEGIHEAIDFEALIKLQKEDEEMKQYKAGKLGLKLKRIPIPDSALYCDTSTQTARPYVTQLFRRQAFQALHNLAHPGVKATVKLVTERYIWPDI